MVVHEPWRAREPSHLRCNSPPLYQSGLLCLELEQRLARRLEVPFVVLTMSGSAALMLSLMTSGVGPGDKVILSAGGFIASHAAKRRSRTG